LCIVVGERTIGVAIGTALVIVLFHFISRFAAGPRWTLERQFAQLLRPSFWFSRRVR